MGEMPPSHMGKRGSRGGTLNECDDGFEGPPYLGLTSGSSRDARLVCREVMVTAVRIKAICKGVTTEAVLISVSFSVT